MFPLVLAWAGCSGGGDWVWRVRGQQLGSACSPAVTPLDRRHGRECHDKVVSFSYNLMRVLWLLDLPWISSEDVQ